MVIWTSDLVVRIGTWCFVFEDYHAVKETYMLPFFSLIVFFSIEIICVFDFFTSFKYIYGSLWIKLENWDELLNKKNKNVVVVFSVQIDTNPYSFHCMNPSESYLDSSSLSIAFVLSETQPSFESTPRQEIQEKSYSGLSVAIQKGS